MKTNNLDCQPTTELSPKELTEVTGGNFGYDFGFALRELFILVVNGPLGGAAVLNDVAINYRPIK